jgi:hypothetical protein
LRDELGAVGVHCIDVPYTKAKLEKRARMFRSFAISALNGSTDTSKQLHVPHRVRVTAVPRRAPKAIDLSIGGMDITHLEVKSDFKESMQKRELVAFRFLGAAAELN